jgi:site-specific DNA recombinase
LLLEEFERVGCTVTFLNHAFSNSPEEQMLLQMQGVFAEYERAQIQERTRRGRLFAARKGRVNWGQNATYGYRYLRKTETTPQQLVVEEREAAVVRQIYQWLVEEQMSSYAIQKRLTERQIPIRSHNQQGWAQSTVIEILRTPIYTGQTHYNRTQVADARRPKMERSHKDQRPGNGRGRVLRPKEEWIPVQVPAVIDPELWSQAQAQLARNREQATRNNTKHDYLLRSLLVCGKCGRRLVGTWSKLGQGRYVCLGRYPRSAVWSCDGRSLSAARVESQVWEYVSGLLSDADLLKARYDESRGDPAIVSREERERERIERQLAALKKEVERLIDAYQAGVIELSQLQERRKRNEEHSGLLQRRLNELEQQRWEREQEIRLLQSLEQFCASVRDALVTPSFETKQKMLQLVVDRILVEDTKLTIRHIVPTGPVRLQTEPHVATTPSLAPERDAFQDTQQGAAILRGKIQFCTYAACCRSYSAQCA